MPAQEGLGNCLYKFCSEESTDSVDCRLVSNQPLRCVSTTGTMTVNTRSIRHYFHTLNTILTSQRLV